MCNHEGQEIVQLGEVSLQEKWSKIAWNMVELALRLKSVGSQREGLGAPQRKENLPTKQ